MAKILAKGQNLSIVRFLRGKEWVSIDQIAKEIGLNEPMARLFLHDLENADLLEKKADEEKGKDAYLYRFIEPHGIDMEKALGSIETAEVSPEQIRDIVQFYFDLTTSIAKKLKELGGRSTYENIVVGGTDEIEDVKQLKIVELLKECTDPEDSTEKFMELVKAGGFDEGDVITVRSAFKEIIKKILEANENFMGKLYGRQVVMTSTKNVVRENEELIEKMDLLRGLPKEYFSVGGI